jgi:acyl-CoA thioesterase I
MALVALLYLVLLAAMLCGCGGEPPGYQPENARESAPTSPPVDGRPIIAAFGDSLTEGFGVDSSRSYPEVLQRELDRLGYRYRVVNLGLSGDTTTGGLARIDAVLALKPAFVILEFGANDGLRGLPVAQTKANLEKMIAALQKAGAKVILAGMTLPPNYGPEYIRRFEGVFRDLAAKYRTGLIPFLLEGVAGNGRLMQRDGLHPNAAGYPRVAANVFKALEPELKARAEAGAL